MLPPKGNIFVDKCQICITDRSIDTFRLLHNDRYFSAVAAT